MTHESRRADDARGGSAMSVGDLLRMLEAAVEKENSTIVETSTKDELHCSSVEREEAGWTRRHEAFHAKIGSKLEATLLGQRAEGRVEVIEGREVQGFRIDTGVDSRKLTSDRSGDVKRNCHSTPEEILGNFESMIQEIMVSGLPSQAASGEFFNSAEVTPGHDNSADDPGGTVSSTQKVGALALESKKLSDDRTLSDAQDNDVHHVLKVLQRDISSESSEPDWSDTGLCRAEEQEQLFCDIKNLSPEFLEKDGQYKPSSYALLQRVQEVALAEGDTSDGHASQGRPSLLEAIRKLDSKCEVISSSKDQLVGDVLSDGNEAHRWKDAETWRGSEKSFQSSFQGPEEISKPDIIKNESSVSSILAPGRALCSGEAGGISPEPCANGCKDKETVEFRKKSESPNHTRDSETSHANLSGICSANSDRIDKEEAEKSSCIQFITSDHETARSLQQSSTPGAPCRGSKTSQADSTVETACRPIKASDYFQEYGWDDAKLKSVSAQALRRKSEEHQSVYGSEFQNYARKNKVMTVEDVNQITDQARVASKRASEYYSRLQRFGLNEVGMGMAEDEPVARDHKLASATNCEHLHNKLPQGHAFYPLRINDDVVVEHSVGFGSTRCSSSKRARGVAVHSREPCRSEGAVVRDSSQALDCSDHNDSSLSTATFLEVENAAANSHPILSSDHFSDWDKDGKRTSSHSLTESAQSTPSDTFFGQLLSYGRGVKSRRNPRGTPVSRAVSESSVLSKLAREVMERFNTGTPAPAQSGSCDHREKVKVVVRMRPFAEHEKTSPLKQILCIPEDKVIVKENNPALLKQSCIRNKEFRDAESLEFKVDNVVDDSYLQNHRWDKKAESQCRMYELIGLPCLEYALDGYNTTIMAYGQACSGKTYTMMGDDTVEGRGMMPRFAEDLMHQISTEFKNEYLVQVSYLEIYQERIRDLLVPFKVDPQAVRAEWQCCLDSGASRCGSVKSDRNWLESSDDNVYEESMDGDTASYLSFGAGTLKSWKDKRAPSVWFDNPSTKKEYLKLREHPVSGPYVEGLSWKDVYTWEDMEQIMLEGAARRTLGATPTNKCSNRGHTLFTMRIVKEQRGRSPHVSFVNLVDLAGTEKPKLAKRISLERLEESRYINRSVAHLNDVILNLSKNSKFVSYRSSALTWLLRDSLGGTAKTFLIAHLSPAEQDFQESVNTLRYAAKANHIQSSIISHPEKKKQLFVNMKKEAKILQDLIQNLTGTEEDKRRKEELIQLGSCLPVLSSFKVPRVEMPVNSGHWM
ncbi:hypothetical protein MPTK1_5g20930 [Marchantia polymorpha subsp. ruderalis]|uniref:Kinesin motor domain-containing protein n=1 Tax=Marchantia polymorpha subsp. ruderalis TaxID=1480154 RepID=A0AAF6BKJ9_MARPO|nr:hypothetical protein Mp_5g20930 [Marchantia polymorpha subsp. ruderalis]